MQSVQEALIQAHAADLEAQHPEGCLLLDRTERLANSLGKMTATLERLNNSPHDFDIILMAGGRGREGGGERKVRGEGVD